MLLSAQAQSAVRRLLMAEAEPDALLPHAAVAAIDQLLPAEAFGMFETDVSGWAIRFRDLPHHTYDFLSPQVCDGPLPAGLSHLADLPADDPHVAFHRSIGVEDSVQVGFATSSQTVVGFFLDRRRAGFDERDVAILRMLEPALGRLMRAKSRLDAHTALSGSERRVLELVASGASNREVAEGLSVTVATVRKHLEHSYRKLGVTSRTAAVVALWSTS